MRWSDTDLEARLRRDLRAAGDAVPPAPHDLADATRRRHRVLRRRQVGLTAAAVAAVLVLVGVPVVASTFTADSDRGQTARPSTGQDGTLPSLADVPTRGSLAGDEEWLDGVLALDWVAGTPSEYPGMEEVDPPVDTRHVAFAQDVPGGRLALVLGQWGRGSVNAWFLGPENAAPEEMELAAPPSETIADEPLALLDVPDDLDDVRLVVVAFPGDTAEILMRRDVDADGEEIDIWQDLGMDDGAAVASLSGPPLDLIQAGGIWVARGSLRTQQVYPLPTERALRLQLPRIDVADPRRLVASAPVSDELVQQAAHCLVGYFGGPPEDLGLTLLAAGPLGGSSMNQAALVGATFASGAHTACLMTRTTAIDPGSVTGTAVRIDPVPADDVLLVDEVLAVATPDIIAVSGPAAGRTAEIYQGDALLSTVQLDDGAGLGELPLPTATRVRILAADGSLVGEGAVAGEGQ
jgi:hypothetical protein